MTIKKSSEDRNVLDTLDTMVFYVVAIPGENRPLYLGIGCPYTPAFGESYKFATIGSAIEAAKAHRSARVFSVLLSDLGEV